jgi:hypothetical protein
MGVRIKKTASSIAKRKTFKGPAKKTTLKKPKPIAKPAPKKRPTPKRRSK